MSAGKSEFLGFRLANIAHLLERIFPLFSAPHALGASEHARVAPRTLRAEVTGEHMGERERKSAARAASAVKAAAIQKAGSRIHPSLRSSLKRAAGGPDRSANHGLVSVIVPMYNVERYLDRCLTSLVTQSYRRLEIILVDDGSTDTSARIAAGYARYDRRIKIIRGHNAGPGGARNIGIRAARGTLLAFADADDVVPYRAYEFMAASLAQSKSDFCVGSYGRIRGNHRTSVHLADRLHQKRRPRVTLRDVPEIIDDVFLWNKMFQRPFWDNEVGSIPERIRYEDQEATARAYLKASSFDVLPDPVYSWRIREDGSSLTQEKHLMEDLRDRLLVNERVRALLSEGAPEAAVAAWQRRVAGADLIPYLEQAADASDKYWAMLSEGAARLLEGSRQELDRIDPQARALAYLAAANRRDELALALVDRINNGTATPLVFGRTITARPTFLASLDVSVPASLLRVDPSTLELVAAADPPQEQENGVFRVEGYAYVRNAELTGIPTVLTVGTTGTDGFSALPVERMRNPHLDLVSSDRNCSHADAAFAVEMPGPTPELTVRLEVAGHLLERAVAVPAPKAASARRIGTPAAESLAAGPRGSLQIKVSGGPPEASYALVTSRHRIPAETNAVQDGVLLTFPLAFRSWGQEVPAPPSGAYTLRWSAKGSGAGAGDVAVAVQEGVSRSFRSFLTPAARVRGFRTSSGAMAVSITAPLADSEAGDFHQYRLRRTCFAPGREPSLQPGILFESFGGKNCTDSPRAISDYLASAGFDEPLYWSVADRSVEAPPYAVPLLQGSAEWYERLATTRALVNNNNFPWYFRKSPGQFYLQTWHGTPLKKLGLDIPPRNLSLSYRDLMKREAQWWDLLLAQNEFATRTLPAALGYRGDVLSSGYPRNDVLVREGKRDDAVRNRLGISAGQKVILYAPTWRDAARTDAGRPDWVGHLDMKLASRALGPGYTFLIRAHHNVSAQRRVAASPNILDVTDYPDINDLYLAADALVTDYSSAMFDFCLLGKPMYFLVPDLAGFESSRGLYLDLAETVPGVPAANTAELVRMLRQDPAPLIAQVREFSARFAGGEVGRAAQAAAEAMLAATPAFSGAHPEGRR